MDNSAALLKELEDLKKDKMSLLKIISHDIRAPFNRIFAFIQLMQFDGDNLTDEQRIYIDSMYREVMGGLEMIRNLNGMREIDRGDFACKIAAIEVVGLIQKSIKNYEELLRIKKIAISFNKSEESIKVLADEFYFIRIIDNLISNLVKYTFEGHKAIIELEAQEAALCIRFTSEGEMISPTENEMLFTRFGKLTARPTAGESSTGLGLYLSKHYADSMQGELSLIGNYPVAFELKIPLAV
ncbi:MAG: sensor histidine kinase [Cyclobacteriaceae bacterium]